MFDDLSLEQGLPMAQDIARSGIHVIATIGNDCAVDMGIIGTDNIPHSVN